jgi:hypothetical protein
LKSYSHFFRIQNASCTRRANPTEAASVQALNCETRIGEIAFCE